MTGPDTDEYEDDVFSKFANKEMWKKEGTYRCNQLYRYHGEVPNTIKDKFKHAMKNWNDSEKVNDEQIRDVKQMLTSFSIEDNEAYGTVYNNGEYLWLYGGKEGYNYMAVMKGEKMEIYFVFAYIQIASGKDMTFSELKQFILGFF